jgi:hypothetical protein
MLVLGEIYFHTLPERAPFPEWLTIPQRGLSTGIMILAAVGTGKRPHACTHTWSSCSSGVPVTRSARSGD